MSRVGASFFFSSRRRHTRCSRDWSSDVCSSDLVVVPDVGGGFGPKGPIYPEEILVAAAAHRLGRPVKWGESRHENLASMGHDREQTHDAPIGFARDGTIVAVDATFLADVGPYPLQGDRPTADQ